MMAQPSHKPLSSPVSVIGSRFVAPSEIDIIVDTSSDRNLVITDTNHKILLKVKKCDTSFHYQRVLLDANDKPILMMREKFMTGHGRWNVFRGASKSESDIIFTTKEPHMFQCETCLHVCMANKSTDVCDFNIEGSWSKKTCTISVGDTLTTIAQMYKLQTSATKVIMKDKFLVTIYPNVDYAFVVTLIAILEAMKNPETKKYVHATMKASEVMGHLASS